jgi:hypothetical protein
VPVLALDFSNCFEAVSYTPLTPDFRFQYGIFEVFHGKLNEVFVAIGFALFIDKTEIVFTLALGTPPIKEVNV